MDIPRRATATNCPGRSNMKTADKIDAAIERVLDAETADFTELSRLAGLNPAVDFRFSNLSNVNFSGADLTGFDFTGASLEGTNFSDAFISGAKFGDTRELMMLLNTAADFAEFLARRAAERKPPKRSHRGQDLPSLGKKQDLLDARGLESQSALPSFLLGREPQTNAPPNKIEQGIADAFHWLDENPHAPKGAKVLRRLLEVSRTDQKLRKRATAWLDDNPQVPEAGHLLSFLLRLDVRRSGN